MSENAFTIESISLAGNRTIGLYSDAVLEIGTRTDFRPVSRPAGCSVIARLAGGGAARMLELFLRPRPSVRREVEQRPQRLWRADRQSIEGGVAGRAYLVSRSPRSWLGNRRFCKMA